MIRKELDWLFNKFRFKFDIQTNLKITDYLDVTLNLYNGTKSPFRKNNYINVDSNHPRQVFKYMPYGIMVGLSTSSSNIDIFTQNNHEDEAVLKKQHI